MLNGFVVYLLMITPSKKKKKGRWTGMDLRERPALEGHRHESSQCSELLMPLQGLESLSALKCLCTIPILRPFHCITSWHGQHQISPKQSLPLPAIHVAGHARGARMSPLKFRAFWQWRSRGSHCTHKVLSRQHLLEAHTCLQTN